VTKALWRCLNCNNYYKHRTDVIIGTIAERIVKAVRPVLDDFDYGLRCLPEKIIEFDSLSRSNNGDGELDTNKYTEKFTPLLFEVFQDYIPFLHVPDEIYITKQEAEEIRSRLEAVKVQSEIG